MLGSCTAPLLAALRSMTAPVPTIDRPLPVAPPAAPPGPVQTSTTGDGRVTGRGVAAALAVAVVAGALLRLWGLGADRLGYDEAFTAMAGRMPIGDLLAYLRINDSHPPLDYLLRRAACAAAGVNEFLFRLPSAVFSVAALALFAWWMRRYGLAGIVATALLAVSDFELTHGRTARMYAELELIGVLAAVLADSWLRRPRRWHAPALGAWCSRRFSRTCRASSSAAVFLPSPGCGATASRGDGAAAVLGRGGMGAAVGLVVPGAGARRQLRLDPAHDCQRDDPHLRRPRHQSAGAAPRCTRRRGRRRCGALATGSPARARSSCAAPWCRPDWPQPQARSRRC